MAVYAFSSSAESGRADLAQKDARFGAAINVLASQFDASHIRFSLRPCVNCTGIVPSHKYRQCRTWPSAIQTMLWMAASGRRRIGRSSSALYRVGMVAVWQLPSTLRAQAGVRCCAKCWAKNVDMRASRTIVASADNT